MIKICVKIAYDNIIIDRSDKFIYAMIMGDMI